MKRKIIFTAVFILSVILTATVMAQDPMVYPAQGQSEEQMEKDKYQCYTWAKKETGFDCGIL
jgi:hypothetical protein